MSKNSLDGPVDSRPGWVSKPLKGCPGNVHFYSRAQKMSSNVIFYLIHVRIMVVADDCFA